MCGGEGVVGVEKGMLGEGWVGKEKQEVITRYI